MAVNSKADKNHAHSVRRVQKGVADGPALKPTSYSLAQPNLPGSPGSSASGGQISQTGQKALQFRARKVLAPLADPNQSIVE